MTVKDAVTKRFAEICEQRKMKLNELAGISGVLLGTKYSVYPSLGPSMMIKGFIASVIGGLGSLGGAISAAILLGIVEIFLTYWIGSLASPIVLFGGMLLFLVVRPDGISGKFAKDKV